MPICVLARLSVQFICLNTALCMAHLRGPSDAGYCAHTLSAPFRLATPSAPPAKAAQSWWRKAAQSWCICWGGRAEFRSRCGRVSVQIWGRWDAVLYYSLAILRRMRPLSACSPTLFLLTHFFDEHSLLLWVWIATHRLWWQQDGSSQAFNVKAWRHGQICSRSLTKCL